MQVIFKKIRERKRLAKPTLVGASLISLMLKVR